MSQSRTTHETASELALHGAHLLRDARDRIRQAEIAANVWGAMYMKSITHGDIKEREKAKEEAAKREKLIDDILRPVGQIMREAYAAQSESYLIKQALVPLTEWKGIQELAGPAETDVQP